jgi:glycosyltransferase involved in cell wall biosynthesis
VLEAQAASVPIVATSVGGVRELVVDGETGVVVPAGDALALAGGILRLLDSPDEARRLADEARQRVVEHHAKSRMVEATIALYG